MRSVASNSNDILQRTDYFPFGLAHSTSPVELAKNKYLYNGKELQTELGFGMYDYHARMYDASFGIIHGIDPKVEKYFGLSPYVYCANNPIKYIDPDGRDGRVTGSGTKEDPYVIEAVYYYQEGSLEQEQLDGLNAAVSDYNNRGVKSIRRYNLSTQGVEDPIQARMDNTGFETSSGGTEYYGNIVGTGNNREGEELVQPIVQPSILMFPI